MPSQILGRVKSVSGKSYEVKWDSSGKEVYVKGGGGWTYAGKAYSVSEAMNKAEAFVYNK